MISEAVVRALGLTLLHALWQGTLVAMLLAPLLGLMSNRSARARHQVCLTGLMLLLLMPLASFGWLLLTGADDSLSTHAASLVLAGTHPLASWVALLNEHLPALVVAWLVGVGCLGSRGALLWLATRRLVASPTLAAPPALRATVARLRTHLRIDRAVTLVLSARVDVPQVLGWLAPVILIPVGAVQLLTPAQLRAVLAHELAHVARNDHLVAWLSMLAETLLFFHPTTWWLSSRLADEREHACDDVAVSIHGDALGYARALATLDDLAAALAARPTPAPSPALSSQGGSLMSRITRLLGTPRRADRGLTLAAVPVLALGLFSAAALALPAPGDPPCTVGECVQICPLAPADYGACEIVAGERACLISCDSGAEACHGNPAECEALLEGCEQVLLTPAGDEATSQFLVRTSRTNFEGAHLALLPSALHQDEAAAPAPKLKTFRAEDGQEIQVLIVEQDLPSAPAPSAIYELRMNRSSPSLLRLPSAPPAPAAPAPQMLRVRRAPDAPSALHEPHGVPQAHYRTLAPLAPHGSHGHGPSHAPVLEVTPLAPLAPMPLPSRRAFRVHVPEPAPSAPSLPASIEVEAV